MENQIIILNLYSFLILIFILLHYSLLQIQNYQNYQNYFYYLIVLFFI